MNIVGDSEHFKQPYDRDDEYVSKSEHKRECDAVQELGKQLVALSKSQLDKMELDESVLDAVLATKKIKVNTEAYRRQLQFVGKVMRNVDVEPIQAALDRVLNKNNNEAAKAQIFEKHRERLLTQGDSEIQQLLEDHPQLDRQKLRQLVRQANKELAKGPDSKASRELFKYLRDEIGE
ncbi:ribosome biogenesis factor YjgA [Shewanella sedimentimangrovi]|uniref:Dual-action ribosomal maturation protein DarP n=1 Tax=Shewanella sedimentimangrovi TaxID=2814293 RepID=A0ABX7QZ60_9GAMM|nr:ribosome biogenesis factor YjgA [Shewanella sedimentimangrovi]QSX36842.1 ribosome-associated protein [Shewanella sedimentimangrovi]